MKKINKHKNLGVLLTVGYILITMAIANIILRDAYNSSEWPNGVKVDKFDVFMMTMISPIIAPFYVLYRITTIGLT